MFIFKSVETKLKSISIITILGFSILVYLIIFYSQTQEEYSQIKSKSNLLQNEIRSLEYISKEKATNKFFEKYITIIQNLKNLKNSMENLNLNTTSLDKLEKQLIISKTSYQTVFDTQQKIDKHLELMHKSKDMIKEIFQKVYDYKLIQYMMHLELYEKTFFLTHTIDLKEFGKTHFKMRRSVRGSENFTENKPMQKKINGELLQYKDMLEIVVNGQKSIDILQQQLNKNFAITLQILKTNTLVINEEIEQSSNNLLYLILTVSIIIGLIEFIIATVVSKDIVKNLSLVHHGLNDFFDVITYKKDIANEIIINTKDEFYTIANDINKNIHSSVELINHNKEVLEEANDILQKVSNGFYGYKIPHHNNVSPDVKDLIININKMLDETKNKFTILNSALEAYGRYNFEHTIPKKSEVGLYGDFGSLVASTKLIGNNVSEFLAMILNTGDKLNNDTTVLNNSANELSNASNLQAASLEETSASLEEVTKNILDNTNNAKKMAQYAQELTLSSQKGKELASKTLYSMDEINDQVTAINEAINIIDQIAFQTNILSLNAAVEAATAGEAGKGFAVVAQEVRNLASRSADAANEIKALVQNAITKTNEGKSISTQMSNGYEELNEKVKSTTQIIQDVSVASTRQHESIKQINDSIADLDKNTQVNAQNSQYIAQLANSISNLSEDLINASSKATFKDEVRQQVCDIDLVYKTAELKNQHILLKSKNFEKLGTYEQWGIVTDQDCNMGKWLEEQEKLDKKFTKTEQWIQLKKIHSDVHNSIQHYINSNAKRVSNKELREIAATIESNTLMIFDKFNEIKILNCNME